MATGFLCSKPPGTAELRINHLGTVSASSAIPFPHCIALNHSSALGNAQQHEAVRFVYKVDIEGWDYFEGKYPNPFGLTAVCLNPLYFVEFHFFHLCCWSLHGLIATYRCW